MKKKRFLTESDRKQILADKEKSIVENFSKIFDKIKRIDENKTDDRLIGEFIYNSDWDLNFFDDRNIKMVNGNKYRILKVERSDYQGWVVITGEMESLEHGINNYAFIISPKEFKLLKDKIKSIDEYFHDSPSLPNQQMIDWVKKTLHNSAPIELSASFRGMGNEKSINNIMDDFFSRFEKDLDGLSYTDKYKIYLSAREASK
jgi:hypothetical protein